MSFSEAIQSGFRNYVTFSGRAARSEFWFWMLFVVAASFAMSFVDAVAGTGGGLGALFSLATCLPGLAVSVRRLHDSGRSAWWLLILYAPLAIAGGLLVFGGLMAVASIGLGVEVGLVGLAIMGLSGLVALGAFAWWLYVFVQPGQLGMNTYGPQPGHVTAEV